MASYTFIHTCSSMASILPCSCFLVNSPSASRNLQFRNSGLPFQLFLVSNSRCKSVRLELPDISNCYLRALFLPNHIEDAELCEVEGSRARAGGERHLLSRVMLCVPRASAASNQENLLDGPQLLQRQSWFFWVRFLNVFVLWRMAILKEINLKWDKDSARLSRGKGGGKEKLASIFCCLFFKTILHIHLENSILCLKTNIQKPFSWLYKINELEETQY